MRFNRVEFWIQIHNILIIYMTEEIGRSLGGMIGEVRDIDINSGTNDSSRFLRVRAVIDVKDLERDATLGLSPDGETKINPDQLHPLAADDRSCNLGPLAPMTYGNRGQFDYGDASRLRVKRAKTWSKMIKDDSNEDWRVVAIGKEDGTAVQSVIETEISESRPLPACRKQ
ncbi:hypothetical protein LWI28_010026 [Acer negundo]|uniref:DUF4283 domain-containing protein n=1 Tax=Acer negundo TaxID=4023 RepID=A0AAD5NVB2_ACENE|nr:hypothetical protein LWI28_010026 [Acer negundo]